MAQHTEKTQVSSFEDAYDLPNPSFTLQPGPTFNDRRRGSNKGEEPAAFEDQLGFVLVDANGDFEYVDGKLDGSARAFIEGIEVKSVDRYDATGEPWDVAQTPGNGFYGANRDGVYHYDGEPAGFGDFGTIASGVRDLAWSAPGADPMAGAPSNITVAIPVDGTARFSMPSLAAAEEAFLSSGQRWVLSGDFDLQLEWSGFALAGGSAAGAGLRVAIDPQTYAWIYRDGPSGQIHADVVIAGGAPTSLTFTTSATAGFFKITRTGSSVSLLYDIGGGFVNLLTSDFFADPLQVTPGVFGTTGSSGTADLLGITANSGVVDNTAGWAREAAGPHRNTAAAFPQKAAIIATVDSLNIIDETTNSLWMRFVFSVNNALGAFVGDVLEAARMRNGVLLVCAKAADNQGFVAYIDFNLDCIRLHRIDAEVDTGANYKTAQDYAGKSRDSSVGHIALRNGGFGYGGDFTQWRIPGNQGNDAIAVYEAVGGNEYRAAATGLGMSIHRWRRWYLEGVGGENTDSPDDAHSANLDAAYWCDFINSTLELIYVTDTHVRGVDKATYDVRLNGGFGGAWLDAVTTEKAIPGTRIYPPQKSAAIVGSDVFVPANEGIYSAAWPVGSFGLQYGKPGSGAAFEILESWHTIVTRLGVTIDGVTPLLLAAVEDIQSRMTQVVAIKLSDNTIYAKTPVKLGRGGTVRTVA